MDNENLNDLDLTDSELNKIFFGSNEPSENFQNDKPEKSEKKTNGPKKLKRKNSTKKKSKKTKSENDEKKRPQGRPKKWTPEKIAQAKEERRQKTIQRRLQRQEKLKIAQLSGDHVLSHDCQHERLNEVLKTKEEIEEAYLRRRKENKKALNRQYVLSLDKYKKCKDHLYKFSHFDLKTNKIVGECKKCSGMKIFNIPEWDRYLRKNRSRL